MHRTIFSYYGGKGMLASRYPEPKHKTIIEPFAGGAAYSLKYYNKNVFLYDTNPTTCLMWEFMLSKDAPIYIKKIPQIIKPGDKIDNIINGIDLPAGLISILRSACNVGTAGINRKYNTITKIAAAHWKHNTIDKLLYWWPKIKHWKINNSDYNSAPNNRATWFIDPPYNNSAGKLYGNNNIDYNQLAIWCKKRRGQLIVCENEDAEWLPFTPFSQAPGINSKHQIKRGIESIYVR